jgi:hypothetical protein
MVNINLERTDEFTFKQVPRGTSGTGFMMSWGSLEQALLSAGWLKEGEKIKALTIDSHGLQIMLP